MRALRSTARMGVVAIFGLTAACGGGGNAVEGTADPTTTGPDGSPVAEGRCADADAPAATSLLACVGPSIAFIDTPFSSGSGILVADGYVVTNAHVIDPFGEATVTFSDGEAHEHVPVVGADLLADIALLGPIETDRAPLQVEDNVDLTQGEDVYLVGYPGETDLDAPELAISRGILSRTREAKPFGLEFLQTDAAIGGGQSGGALVDAAGRVIGVSGLSLDEFALALAGDHVAASVASILAGDSTPYRPLPGATTNAVSVHIEEPEVDQGWLVLPYSDEDATVRITLRSAATATLVVLDMLSFEPTFVNQAAIDFSNELLGGEVTGDPASFNGGREVEPGVFEIDVPAETYLQALIATTTGPADVEVSTDPAVMSLPDPDQRAAFAVGDEIDAILDSLEPSDTYLVELAAGQKVTISASSPTGDMAVIVQAPGQPMSEVEFFDDSERGLLGYDVEESYTADVAGIHVLTVISNDGLSTGYRFSLTPA